MLHGRVSGKGSRSLGPKLAQEVSQRQGDREGAKGVKTLRLTEALPLFYSFTFVPSPTPRIGLESVRHRDHEEDVPAQQSAAEEDPRVLGSDADERRPPGPEAAAAERPKAHRGLSRSEGGVVFRAPMPPPEGRRLPAGAEEGHARAGADVPRRRRRKRPRPRPAGPDRQPQGRGRGGEESVAATAPRELQARAAAVQSATGTRSRGPGRAGLGRAESR